MENFLQTPLPQKKTELLERLEKLAEFTAQTEAEIKDFMDREDFERKLFFSRELHLLRQRKILLQSHNDFARLRLSRLQSEDYSKED